VRLQVITKNFNEMNSTPRKISISNTITMKTESKKLDQLISLLERMEYRLVNLADDVQVMFCCGTKCKDQERNDFTEILLQEIERQQKKRANMKIELAQLRIQLKARECRSRNEEIEILKDKLDDVKNQWQLFLQEQKTKDVSSNENELLESTCNSICFNGKVTNSNEYLNLINDSFLNDTVNNLTGTYV
jgi:hypothetical protein